MLSETIPTLEFAKDCIEECGGKRVMLNNIRMAMAEEKRRKASRDKGKIPEMRRCTMEAVKMTFNSSLTHEEQERMISQKLEAIRKLEVRRTKNYINKWRIEMMITFKTLLSS